MYKTYKITFNMESAICFNPYFLPVLDSILAECKMKTINKDNHSIGRLNIEEDDLIDFSNLLPLEYRDGYALCSFMFYENALNYISSWKKRWNNKNDDIVYFGKNKKRRIKINEGQFRSYNMPLDLYKINKVWFYLKSNNINQVQYLIKNCLVGIGKKISIGYGWLASFSIKETNEVNFDNQILRPIPISIINNKELESNKYKDKLGICDIKNCGWKPPYWLPLNQEVCIYPSMQSVLKAIK